VRFSANAFSLLAGASLLAVGALLPAPAQTAGEAG
jgi:hypothetical protein